jgi:flagellar basal-body rod protein FlgC
MPSSIDNYLGVHAAALKLRSQRTEVLAANLANADTPGYRARDIDFKGALAAASGQSGGGVHLATTRAGHIGTAVPDGTPRQHRRRPARAGGLRREHRAIPGDSVVHQLEVPGVDDGDHRAVTIMSSFKIFEIAGSGMSAQSVRLNTTASNLANADSVSGDPNQVYKAKHPLFEAIRASLGSNAASSGVAVKGIVENQAAPTARYEPGNPLADANGYVFAPNVNTVEEMVDMISASRSYQNNVEVMNTAKEMMLATLRLGQ